MKKFFGADGGLYLEGIHKVIPVDAKEISDTQYAQILSAPSRLKEISRSDSGAPVELAPPPMTVLEMRGNAIRQLGFAAAKAIRSISASYPQFEIDTWDAQESEARAWLADNSAVTPTLSPIAAMRGISVADLAVRVIAKAEAFRPVVAAVVGKRQAIEDQIERTTAQTEIDALVLTAHDLATWNFT